MDLETKCFIQDVQIVELNEQLTQCRAENDKLKSKLKKVQDVLNDKRVIYEENWRQKRRHQAEKNSLHACGHALDIPKPLRQ